MSNDLTRQGEYAIDERTEYDFISKMKELAKSYAPEWTFDENDPDIAATIAILYGKQLAENVQRINCSIDQYHTAFINLLDINAKPAKPAESVVIMELSQQTITGVQVPRGTKLYSENVANPDNESLNEDISDVVFETQDDLYVTRAKIANIFLTDYKNGSIKPVLGRLNEPLILNKAKDATEREVINLPEGDEQPEPRISQIEPFSLFGGPNGIEKNISLIYHSYVLDTVEDSIFVTFTNGDKLVQKLASGSFKFQYPYDEKLVPFEYVKLLEDGCTFEIKKNKKSDLQDIYGSKLDVIAIVSEGMLDTDYSVSAITLSAKGKGRQADYVGSADNEFKRDSFAPFTEKITTYNECFIASEACFSKSGSVVTLDFDLSFEERIERLTAAEREAELKVIRKKPSDDTNLNPADVFVNKIAIEYYNGIGWKILNCDRDYSRLFENPSANHVQLKFVCPEDWEESQSGAHEGRLLKLSVLQAENCYMLPSLHHYPIIKKLKISFDYENKRLLPDLVSVIAGTDRINVVHEIKLKKPYNVLMANKYTQDSMYIGLDERPELGPIGIFVGLLEEQRYDPIPLRFEYSGPNGFEPLKVVDGTEQFSHSGLIYFVPPPNMLAEEIEGNKNYWIRVSRATVENEIYKFSPIIETILINGVKIANVETKQELSLFIDEIIPDISMDLAYKNILYCDVWVNETASLSRVQMEKLLIEDKDNVRVERDIRGNVSAFYVRWTEVEQFNAEAPYRSYLLDRLESKLIFGDGIKNDIPRCTDDIAVRVNCKCSVGRLGNVEAGSINSLQSTAPFIGGVYNPIMAYGGSSMETLESTLERGANIIATRKRLVSKKDYIMEVKGYSDVIDQVVAVSNIKYNGSKEDGAMTFCLLMKDYEAGSHSFHRLVAPLKEYLLTRCEMTVDPNQLYIVEPVFVELSITLWASNIKLDDNFYLINYLNELMAEYLNPLQSKGGSFTIGNVPTVDQIRLRLNNLKNKLVIQNITILAKYTDETGIHEVALENLKKNPFMIVTNGKHYIK